MALFGWLVWGFFFLRCQHNCLYNCCRELAGFQEPSELQIEKRNPCLRTYKLLQLFSLKMPVTCFSRRGKCNILFFFKEKPRTHKNSYFVNMVYWAMRQTKKPLFPCLKDLNNLCLSKGCPLKHRYEARCFQRLDPTEKMTTM